MLTATTIRAVDSIAKASKQGRRVNGLFRLLENPVLWMRGYADIYSNAGAMTKGVGDNTLDGFAEERVNNLIKMLKARQYRFTPVRRTYIPKKDGKVRPLGIPTGNDKLVQEVFRILLEQVYEPVFSENSHGFRPNKSCHTALKQVKDKWTGMKWIVEIDIKSFFDSISHEKLVEILEKKIDDKRTVSVIKGMLKAGYMEDWKYNSTYSGTPQGGIISPILANIYLHELDMFMETMTAWFNKGKTRRRNPKYSNLQGRTDKLTKEYKRLKEENAPKDVLRNCLEKRRNLVMTKQRMNLGDPFDANYKRLQYVRYADDFVIGIIGSKADAEQVFQKVKQFIETELLLEISEKKSCIRLAKNGVRFLGYDIRTYTGAKIKNVVIHGIHTTMRTVTQQMQLHVPAEKMAMFCGKCGYGNYNNFRAQSRGILLRRSDAEIIETYNSEIRGLVNYYSLAQAYKTAVDKLVSLATSSCLATLAHKHKSTTAQVAKKLRQQAGGYALICTVKGNPKTYKLFRLADHSPANFINVRVDVTTRTEWLTMSRTELISRLSANRCEYCGKVGGYMEVHHVRKMADVKGKLMWQKIMSAMRRKTLVLCIDCHKQLHSPTGLPDWRALTK